MADANIKTDLGSMTRAELEDYIRSIGESRFRAAQIAEWLYKQGVQSLMVEGGAKTLQGFIDAGLCDEIRVETVPMVVSGGTKAPHLDDEPLVLADRKVYDRNIVDTFRRGDSRE